MAFNTRRGIGIFGQDEEDQVPPGMVRNTPELMGIPNYRPPGGLQSWDPNNPYGEQPDSTIPPNNTQVGMQPSPMAGNARLQPPGYITGQGLGSSPIVPPESQTQPPFDDTGRVGGPQRFKPPQSQPLPPQQRPNRPIPSNLLPAIKAIDPASAVREGEINRDYDKQRDNPYSDTNFNRPGGLGDQMRGKAYDDNDNMMDAIMFDRENNSNDNSWYKKNFPNAGENKDYPLSPKFKNRILHDELLQAGKKGINPVPWSRRNRALE